jgi:hypothetical protein
MKLTEAFASKTYRPRRVEKHYAVAQFENGKFRSFIYDEYDRPIVYADPDAAQTWMENRLGRGIFETRVIQVDITPRKK